MLCCLLKRHQQTRYEQTDAIFCSIIYVRLFGEAIHLCIQYCLAEVPGCEQYYTNIVRSLFQNGRQRAEIAMSLIFVMFIE